MVPKDRRTIGCYGHQAQVMDFLSFCAAHGVLLSSIPDHGRWHRVPTDDKPRSRNGAVKFLGDIGFVQNHATMETVAVWRPEKEYVAPKIDGAVIARKRAAERQALIQATQSARKFYLNCVPLKGGHPYLTAHELSMAGCFGLKLDRDGWLVIPVLRNGLISVQRISPEGEKKFWYGASVKGGSYTIERPGASLTVLVEGFATGAAIFAAVPLSRIVVCFNAGNLSKVSIPIQGMAVVAADNDYQTEGRLGRNPGLEAAQAVAEALGCGVAAPTGINGTDWADFRQETVAARLADRGKQREGDIRRAVDAEIAAGMMRNARFLRAGAA